MNLTKFLALLLAIALLQFSSCVPEEEVCDETATSTEACSDDSEADDPVDGTDPIEDNPPVEPTPAPTPQPTPDPDQPRVPEPTETIETSFFSPWNKSSKAIVIDAYEQNGIDWDEMAKDTRMVGVIHRSSIGLRVDKKYVSRRKIAKDRGYLWGAYHLGYTGNVRSQVELFLDLVGDDEDTLMILDLEDTNNGRFMTISEAEQFMELVFERTGKIPVVYANHSTTRLLNTRVRNNILFKQAKLWYARFKSNVTDFPIGVWKNYFLWQFSSEINCSRTGSCLYNVPGTRFDMDVNVFYGTPSDLEGRWHNY